MCPNTHIFKRLKQKYKFKTEVSGDFCGGGPICNFVLLASSWGPCFSSSAVLGEECEMPGQEPSVAGVLL